MQLTLGISPCPNDTFIFDAIYHKRIPLEGLEFKFEMMDVEQLNKAASATRLDVTKLSYFAYTGLTPQYQMLRSGGALGHNCGPLLVAATSDFLPSPSSRVAIPGLHTTANFLLSRAFPFITSKEEVLFSEIEDAVLSGDFDAGLIIHESRFTYQDKGLYKIRDLGQYWEDLTHTPIPLGGIVVRRSLPEEVKKAINRVIANSVQYAFANPAESRPFILAHAQEMDLKVVDAHISLYVNELSVDLGPQGLKGVDLLFAQLAELGKATDLTFPLFVDA